VLLQFQRPGRELLLPVAVLLLDPATDRLHIRGREDYTDIADAEDMLVLTETVKQLQADAYTQTGGAILELLESTLSNSLRVTDRITMRVPNIESALGHLAAAFLP
jgi:hypothetical protein